MMMGMRIFIMLVVLWMPLAARDVQVAVTDVTKAVAVGAEVVVTCEGGWSRAGKSGADGVAVFSGVPAGACDVRVTQPGFAIWRGKLAGADRVEAQLALAVIANTTEVKAKSAGPLRPTWRNSSPTDSKLTSRVSPPCTRTLTGEVKPWTRAAISAVALTPVPQARVSPSTPRS